ncbi:MAG TPA: VanZ family protein [Thermoanaerobaculia bacterium]|nr:VanZ family protein [Thermoanaerobaculia bacterium]
MRQLPLVFALVATVAAVALRRTRWAAASLWVSRVAYGLLVLQAPLYFLAEGGFRPSSQMCEWTFSLALARHSFGNYPHIVLFTVFFLLTYAQLPHARRRVVWSVAATLGMGLLVELAQGVSGHGHCRMRDLIPDFVGALLGFIIMAAETKLWRLLQRRRTSA